MSRDFFDRLDAELAELTRHGAHLTVGDRVYRRAGRLVRRGVAFALVAVALAAALVSEFPASASGHAQVAQALTAQRL
jgi:membrane-associated PAP2 superfamily phosphatase